MKYIIRDREAGNEIASFDTLAEAQAELEAYEAQDKADGTYTGEFYEIAEVTDTADRIKKLRSAAGLSQKAFAEKFNIPTRTVQNWEYGVNEAPEYLLDMLERVASNEDPQIVIIATAGRKEIAFVGDRKTCAKYEEAIRHECRRVDPDGAEIDCYTKSILDIINEQRAQDRWEDLTEEEKNDYIQVNGKKYVRKIWEDNHSKE